MKVSQMCFSGSESSHCFSIPEQCLATLFVFQCNRWIFSRKYCVTGFWSCSIRASVEYVHVFLCVWTLLNTVNEVHLLPYFIKKLKHHVAFKAQKGCFQEMDWVIQTQCLYKTTKTANCNFLLSLTLWGHEQCTLLTVKLSE